MPDDFNVGGRALWDAVTEAHELDPVQLVQLTEACRAKDRLDRLDELLRGDVALWVSIVGEEGKGNLSLRVDAALDKANTTANLLKQLVAALRLPDADGKRPQYRGPRGAQAPSVPMGVSSLDRARARKRA